MNGLHIISNFYGCNFDFAGEAELLSKVAVMCTEAGLTVVGTSQHVFQPCGVTFTVLLAESHVSFHTWPEDGNIALDIYTCNYYNDNTEKTKSVYNKLKALLKPGREDTKFLDRESLK